MKKRIVIFASGSGTNAQNIINYFKSSSIAEVVLVVSNNTKAEVLQRAKNENIKTYTFKKDMLSKEDGVLKILKEARPDLIVLAGFLLKVPRLLLNAFPGKVINIHPALLPKYGGKGMYGHHVHQAVIDNKETETGITIHFVNEHYDEGAVIFQTTTPLTTEDDPETTAAKVRVLEHRRFPEVIEQLLIAETDD